MKFLLILLLIGFCCRAVSLNEEKYDDLQQQITELREYSEQLCREYHAMARDLERHLDEDN